MFAAEKLYVYKKTYYRPADFDDSRYDPCFSPLVYSGQTVFGSVMIPNSSECDSYVCLYIRDAHTGDMHMSERQKCERGHWIDLAYQIPAMDGVLLEELGFLFEVYHCNYEQAVLIAFVDDLMFAGVPDYRIDFARESVEFWNISHQDVSQMTCLKGHIFLQDKMLHLSCGDYGESYTGRYDFSDYEAIYEIRPVIGERHFALVRVQGACRNYAFGFDGEGRISLLKKEKDYRRIVSTAFDWHYGQIYTFCLLVRGNSITGRCDNKTLTFADDRPYLQGSVGVAVRDGSHIAVKSIAVRPLNMRSTKCKTPRIDG